MLDQLELVIYGSFFHFESCKMQILTFKSHWSELSMKLSGKLKKASYLHSDYICLI